MPGVDAARLRAFEDFALRLADAAKPVALRYFRKPLAIDTKADESPVTIADREIETALRTLIQATHPDHGILGEEHGRSGLDREFLWVIDPIDGTKSFISGMPTFGVLIALLQHGRPLLGIADHPAMGERFVGIAGAQTRWNGAGCRVRDCRRLKDAILFATTPDMFEGDAAAPFERVSRAAKVRRFGGDCFAYAMLAGGHVDAVVEAQLQPYDYMALVPMVEGAGGIITDWTGAPLTIDSDGRVIAAATASLHKEIRDQLNP
ncbi:MAG TPA: histidinol-phosphatase [Beijerinckiaceae bacterium]|nr:histidinol-phosphatase [Beijerinckiaceae bacterium]